MQDVKRIASEVVNEQQSTRLQAERITILKWLGAVFTDQEYESALSARVRGTCQWILRTTEFDSWLNDREEQKLSKILWIHAPAGFGKTILCASITNHLRQNTSVPVAYFFCSYREAATQEPYALLRSWIGQMVCQFQSAHELAKQEHYGKEGRTATYSELLRLFQNIASTFDGSASVVDGLDECFGSVSSASADHAPFIDILSSVIGCVAQSHCRLLLVSREDVVVRQALTMVLRGDHDIEFNEYQINPPDNQKDIIALCASQIDRTLVNKQESLREALSTQAAGRSDGMFLWFKLLSRRMTPGMNPKQLSDIIHRTPSGLHGAYGREIDRIKCLHDEDRDRALLILFWVLVAERPLTVRELSEALLIHVETTVFPGEDLPDAWDQVYVDDRMRKLCGSLVEVRGLSMDQPFADQVVRFVHFSIREYLLDPKQSPTWLANGIKFSNIEGLNYHAAYICLRYLCLTDLAETSPLRRGSLWPKVQTHALLEYAVREWHVHAHKSRNFSKNIVPFVNYFFDAKHGRWLLWAKVSECLDRQDRRSHMEAIETADRSPWYRMEYMRPLAPPLYYAALLGFTETVQFLHVQGADINAEDGKIGSALSAAAAGSHVSVVQYLIDHGASVDTRTKYLRTALIEAASNWGRQMVFPYKPDPLFRVVDRAEESMKVMKILVDAGADIGRSNFQGNALHEVAAIGDIDAIDFLLDHGADIDSRTDDGKTPTQSAMRCGNDENAEHLIRGGANIHETEGGHSVLIEACGWGSARVVDSLLKRGADVRKRSWGRQPLHWAAARDQHPTTKADSTSIIKMLIHHGAVPGEVEERMGRTSLSLAAASGHSAIVEALCEAHASLDIQDILGQTALHLAVIARQPYVVELLLSHGANPCMTDHFGRAPIHWAKDDQNLQALLHPSHTGGPAYKDHNKERETLHGYIVSILHDIESCLDLSRHAWIMLGQLLHYANDHEEACRAYEQILVATRVNIKLNEHVDCQCCFTGIYKSRKYHVCCRCPDFILCAGHCFQEAKNRPLHPTCEGYEYLGFPSDWWSLILEGKVNVRGETLTEWLERLRDTYGTEEASLSYL